MVLQAETTSDSKPQNLLSASSEKTNPHYLVQKGQLVKEKEKETETPEREREMRADGGDLRYEERIQDLERQRE